MADVAESIELATLDKEMAEEKVSSSSLLFMVFLMPFWQVWKTQLHSQDGATISCHLEYSIIMFTTILIIILIYYIYIIIYNQN